MAIELGLQMFSVRFEFQKDPLGTLRRLADIGYTAVEFCNFAAEDYPESLGVAGLSEKDLIQTAKEVGINLTGGLVLCQGNTSHPTIPVFYPMKDLNRFWNNLDLMKRLAAYFKSIGSDHLSTSIDYYPDKDFLLKRCELYNKIGEVCHAEGLEFYFHNHYHEFQNMFDECTFDLIMENTDPELVKIEFDAYWAFRGGVNPADYMRKYGKRIKELHVKDFPFYAMENASA